MFAALNRLFAPLRVWQVGVVSLLLIGLLGCTNYVIGTELSFSIFYLLPVAIAAWFGSSALSWTICLLSASTWLSVDLIHAKGYSHPAIPFWNATVRLGFFIVVAHLLQQLHEALRVQQQLAQRDGLTGLLNARAFSFACTTMFDLAARHRRPLVLGYFDVDGFKGINDRLGHSTGDEVLKAIAEVMRGRMRASDHGGRLGGDEFAVLLPVTDADGGRAFFAELRSALLAMAAERGWPIGFSIGVSVFDGAAVKVDEAIGFVDNLMYRVKNSGKNAILFEAYAAGGDAAPSGRSNATGVGRDGPRAARA